MTDGPIIFSAESVAAIQRGDKTMARRVLKPQPPVDYSRCSYDQERSWWYNDEEAWWPDDDKGLLFPVRVGDRLWCKERISVFAFDGWAGTVEFCYQNCVTRTVHFDTSNPPKGIRLDGNKFRSPLFMPKWASRLKLEVTGVRPERIQDIMGSGGVLAEGYKFLNTEHGFVQAWDALNGKRGFSWDSDPWVFAYTFRMVDDANQAA